MNVNDRLLSELDALRLLRDPVRRRLYEYVARSASQVSRDEAANAMGISRGLAAFHLEKLFAAGLLGASYQRASGKTGPGAGRPSKLYRRSRRRFHLSLPQREHELLASFLAGSSVPEDDEITPSEPARQYGRSLGARARRRLRRETSGRLLGCVEQVLERLGFAPYRRVQGAITLRNCPFDPLSRRFTPIVCGAGLSLVEGVVSGVGAPAEVGREPKREECCVYVGTTPD